MTMVSYLVCDWCDARIDRYDDHAEIHFISRDKPMIDKGLRHMCTVCSEHLQEILRDEIPPGKTDK